MRHGIERAQIVAEGPSVKSGCERLGEVDMVKNVTQRRLG